MQMPPQQLERAVEPVQHLFAGFRRLDGFLVLEVIQAQRAEGRSLRAIADHLNGRGFTTRAGSSWRFEYVRSVLQTVARAAA
jgi:hypothetical protein